MAVNSHASLLARRLHHHRPPPQPRTSTLAASSKATRASSLARLPTSTRLSTSPSNPCLASSRSSNSRPRFSPASRQSHLSPVRSSTWATTSRSPASTLSPAATRSASSASGESSTAQTIVPTVPQACPSKAVPAIGAARQLGRGQDPRPTGQLPTSGVSVPIWGAATGEVGGSHRCRSNPQHRTIAVNSEWNW